jgi:small Trp-rich protein
MYLLIAGCLMLLMKYMEVGPPTDWSWWVVLTPFGLAVLWWWWADFSGYTKKKQMEKEDARRKARIDKSREALGMGPKKRR